MTVALPVSALANAASGSKPDPAALAALPMFSGLDTQALENVVAAAHLKRIRKGHEVFSQGAAAEHFYVLLNGYIKAAQVTASGQQAVSYYVNPREFFGCAAVTGLKHHPLSAIAVQDSTALSWNGKAMLRLMNAYPSLAINLLAGLDARMTEILTRTGAGHTERVSRRIARGLLHLVRSSGRQVEAGIKVDFPITRQDLAEMTGTTLFTVSRTLSQWQRRGIILSSRQTIVVIDPHRLIALANEDEGVSFGQTDAAGGFVMRG